MQRTKHFIGGNVPGEPEQNSEQPFSNENGRHEEDTNPARGAADCTLGVIVAIKTLTVFSTLVCRGRCLAMPVRAVLPCALPLAQAPESG